ncbi:MAG TPA: hypothetical protein PKA42_03300 [Candidatus Paceibacterota bacterium]|nr:hypothetical protein [Candidatus Paceibacterota bacterium]HMO83168.1 hypothetical protein [Candidatus Paceibacterota bacterium]
MFVNYFDDKRVTEIALNKKLKALTSYREKITKAIQENDATVPEHSLYHSKDFTLHEAIAQAKKKFKLVDHVVLIGIGGSSLGTEAVHAILNQGKAKLTVLDTVSAYKLDLLIKELLAQKSLKKVAFCVVSKSGTTTETLANSAALLETLQKKFGDAVYEQTIFIGNPDTSLMQYGHKRGVPTLAMPEIIGGRYSVATVVGLVPLALLGHDTDDFIAGYLDANQPNYEAVTAENAVRLALYHELKYPHYNFFAFESRLEKLGHWYRQLFAESLGKETDQSGKAVKNVMVPTISTPTELHSVGQLYLSGTVNHFTDFVTFDDEVVDIKLSNKNKLASSLVGLTLQEVATALYGGVMAAYQERQLPYRTTIFEEALPYSVGLFMGMRLREVMYIAHLLKVNAFNQPNVEIYKTKTKEILGL